MDQNERRGRLGVVLVGLLALLGCAADAENSKVGAFDADAGANTGTGGATGGTGGGVVGTSSLGGELAFQASSVLAQATLTQGTQQVRALRLTLLDRADSCARVGPPERPFHGVTLEITSYTDQGLQTGVTYGNYLESASIFGRLFDSEHGTHLTSTGYFEDLYESSVTFDSLSPQSASGRLTAQFMLEDGGFGQLTGTFVTPICP